MNTAKRYYLSNKSALYTRKYFLGPLLLITGTLMISRSSGFLIFLGLLLSLIGLFYMILRTIQFDSEHIYIGRKRYQFEQIIRLSHIEINMYVFPVLEISDKGRKRTFITDSGQAGLLRILLGILFPALDPMKNIKKFEEFHEASKQPSSNHTITNSV